MSAPHRPLQASPLYNADGSPNDDALVNAGARLQHQLNWSRDQRLSAEILSRVSVEVLKAIDDGMNNEHAVKTLRLLLTGMSAAGGQPVLLPSSYPMPEDVLLGRLRTMVEAQGWLFVHCGHERDPQDDLRLVADLRTERTCLTFVLPKDQVQMDPGMTVIVPRRTKGSVRSQTRERTICSYPFQPALPLPR